MNSLEFFAGIGIGLAAGAVVGALLGLCIFLWMLSGFNHG